MGRQCTYKQARNSDGLCTMHFGRQTGSGWHGRVDGPIPEAKLKAFQDRARSRNSLRGLPAGDEPLAGVGSEAPAASSGVRPAARAAAADGAVTGAADVGRVDVAAVGGSSLSRAEGRRAGPATAQAVGRPMRSIVDGRIVDARPGVPGGAVERAGVTSTQPGAGAPGFVTGFGPERVEGPSLPSIQAETEYSQCATARERREEGTRGAVRDRRGDITCS